MTRRPGRPAAGWSGPGRLSLRLAAALLGLVSGPAELLRAQAVQIAGTVVRLERGDTVPVAAIPVVLHRVSRSLQGPLDTTRSDARGRFRIAFRGDSAVYLLSVRFRDIEYFSQPVSLDPARPDTALLILVADTSTVAPIRIAERTLLVGRPDQSGSRAVIDWLVLVNPSERTRVSGDTGRASWGIGLPAEAQNVALADVHLSQFSPDAVVFRRDSVLVFAPISPGRKELVLQYHLPGREQSLTVPAPDLDSIFVLLEEPGAVVVRPALPQAPAERVEDRTFQRWAGTPGDSDRIEIRFPQAGPSPGTLLIVLVGALGLGFAILAARLFRSPTGPAETAPHPAALADAIARLDERYLDPAASFSAEERDRYRAERARLKAELVGVLERSSRPA